MSHGWELIVLLGILVGLALGVVPGLWVGAHGYDRTKGHPLLAAIVAVFAIGGLLAYTVGGPSDETFTRLVILPLSLLVAIASAAILVGVPMYTSYLLAHRVGRRLTSNRKSTNPDR